MPDNMYIYRATAVPNDTAAIVEFNTALALESEGVALEPETLRAGVGAVLADPHKKGFYLLAAIAGRPIGQLMVTYEWSDWRNGWIWWVQSVYVREEYRRQGIYRALYTELRGIARRRGDIRGLRLYVMRENHTAKRTYAAMGMAHSEYDLYESEMPASARPVIGDTAS